MLVQLPRSLHVFTVSDRPRCLSRSASGSIVRLCNRLFSTAPQLVPFSKPLGGRRCGRRQAIRRGVLTQDVLTDCGGCAPMLLGHLTSQRLKTWHWRSVENAILVPLVQATLVSQPLKGFIATTNPAGDHRNGGTVRPELRVARRTASRFEPNGTVREGATGPGNIRRCFILHTQKEGRQRFLHPSREIRTGRVDQSGLFHL